MTYASHARVTTEIIQANLIHLSIKMTMLHQSGAPFVGKRGFQNWGVCGQAFPSFPSPTPFLSPCPIFRLSRMQKTNMRGQNFVRFVRERLLRRLTYAECQNAGSSLSQKCSKYLTRKVLVHKPEMLVILCAQCRLVSTHVCFKLLFLLPTAVAVYIWHNLRFFVSGWLLDHFILRRALD